MWTYDPSQLSSNPVYQVRFELQDTDPNNQRLQDEEIVYALSVENNLWGGAARCAETISRGYLAKSDVKLGRAMTVAYTKMAQQYADMASRLRKKALGTVVPYVGGIYVAGKIAIANNGALVQPAFTRNMQQNPWTGGYTPDDLGPVPSNTDDAGVQFN